MYTYTYKYPQDYLQAPDPFRAYWAEMHKGYDDLQQLLPAFAKLLKHVTQTRSQTPGIMPCLKWPFDHQWFGFLRDAEGSESSL